MTETQKRIAAYKAALPGLKERVAAVALLLVMSMAMMTSATFAWITLSRAPEVSGTSTTLAANGNLEIALVQPDGSQPPESAVGDSSAAPGQSVVNANLTWGNLVNLSDVSYGLSNIVLRPALLGDTTNLLSKPLKGVDYSADGRLQQYYNEDYQFANWTINSDQTGQFVYSAVPRYGVRAISTIEYTYINNRYYEYSQLKLKATGARDAVRAGYDKITSNQDYIDALAALIGEFMADELNNEDTDVSDYVPEMYHMLLDVYNLMSGGGGVTLCFEDALVELANVQMYLNYLGDTNAYDNYTRETLMAATNAELSSKGVNLSNSLQKYKTLKGNIEKMLYGTDPEKTDCLYDYYRIVHPKLKKDSDEVDETYDSGKAVLRSELMPHIANMVDISSTLIIHNGTTYTVATLTADMSNAISIVLSGDKIAAVIDKGYLKDFEQLTGGRLNAKNVDVKVDYLYGPTITASSITTTAASPYHIDSDIAIVDAMAEADKGDYTGVAQDTYGMALDFWVRTNAADSYLVLEGNVLTNTERVRATGGDKNGQLAELYTVTLTSSYTDENGQQQTMSDDLPVYILTEKEDPDDENSVEGEAIYDANNHTRIAFNGVPTTEGQTVSKPIERWTENTTVIGYEGENRVWNAEDKIFIDVDSTTQGSGSCYVFYAEDPAQQQNSLRLLSNLRIAFVDNNEASVTYGKLVAFARLDIDNAYEENGKVTLPLVLEDEGSTTLTKMPDGELAIMKLEQNVPSRLLTLVYLDGRNISNADVLEASDIHGMLNIQFGSTVSMIPIDNEALEGAKRTISAAIKKSTDADYGSNANAITFDYDSATDPMEVTVKVTVDGDSPANVSAFFMRQVNASQGSVQPSFTLNESPTEEGVYTGTYRFTSPGKYILRTVQLDGVDYSLPADEDPSTNNEYPRVEISGFGIDSVRMKYDNVTVTEQSKKIMTGSKSISTDVSLKFSDGQNKLPGSVRVQFEEAGGNLVTANMAYNATDSTWYGTAKFTASGEYTLKFVILDGEYEELAPQYQKILDISLGLTVRVYDEPGSPRETLWEGTPYSIQMRVEIYNENGDPVDPMSNVKLVYGVGSTNVDDMDPDMKWNAEKGRYEGNILISGPGVYNFIRVDAAGNPLTTTIGTAPEFTATSPNPPEYFDANTEKLTTPMADMDYILDPGDGTLKVGLRLAEAASAKVTAVFYNAEDGQEYSSGPVTAADKAKEIDGKPVTEFNFAIPQTGKTPGQTGNWTIKRLELTNVYANGKMYRDGDPLTMNLTHDEEKNDLHVRVVNVNVTASVADGAVLNYTGNFMESKTTTGAITITITDHKGNKLEVPVGDISLVYQLKKDSWKESSADTNYGGGYDAEHLADLNGAGETDTYTIKSSDGGKTFTLDSVKLTYAGIYEPKSMTLTVNGETIPYGMEELKTMGLPSYNLKTTKPNVTVSAVTPTTANMSTYITWTKSKGFLSSKYKMDYSLGGSITNGVEATTNTVTAYARAATSGVTNVGTGDAGYERPTIKFTVSGVDSSSTVKFTIPKGDADAAYNFSQTGNGQSSAITLGTLWSEQNINSGYLGITYTLWGYKGHGSNITINSITIVRGNYTFTVQLTTPIKIINPTATNVEG